MKEKRPFLALAAQNHTCGEQAPFPSRKVGHNKTKGSPDGEKGEILA